MNNLIPSNALQSHKVQHFTFVRGHQLVVSENEISKRHTRAFLIRQFIPNFRNMHACTEQKNENKQNDHFSFVFHIFAVIALRAIHVLIGADHVKVSCCVHDHFDSNNSAGRRRSTIGDAIVNATRQSTMVKTAPDTHKKPTAAAITAT